MKQQPDDLQQLAKTANELIESKKTLLLATVDKMGEPEVSYAPYYRDSNGCFYLFTSELASHTPNLLGNGCASIMFIADEADSNNQFARERVTYSCTAIEIVQGDSDYSAILDALEQEQGNTVQLLRELPDFHLFCLTAKQGRYVVGFGKAYQLDPISGELIHLTA